MLHNLTAILTTVKENLNTIKITVFEKMDEIEKNNSNAPAFGLLRNHYVMAYKLCSKVP